MPFHSPRWSRWVTAHRRPGSVPRRRKARRTGIAMRHRWDQPGVRGRSSRWRATCSILNCPGGHEPVPPAFQPATVFVSDTVSEADKNVGGTPGSWEALTLNDLMRIGTMNRSYPAPNRNCKFVIRCRRLRLRLGLGPPAGSWRALTINDLMRIRTMNQKHSTSNAQPSTNNYQPCGSWGSNRCPALSRGPFDCRPANLAGGCAPVARAGGLRVGPFRA